MELPTLYDALYEDESLLQDYLKAQRVSRAAKAHVTSELVSLLSHELADTSIAVLGADTGTYFSLLREHLPRVRFTLVDKSQDALDLIGRTEDCAGTTFVRADLMKLSESGLQVDVALALLVVHLLPDLNGFFREVSSTLRASGLLLVLTLSPEQESQHPMRLFFGHEAAGSPFPSLADLRACAEQAQLLPALERVITYRLVLSPADVPVFFSERSNSFLFRQPRDRVQAFHRWLRRGVAETSAVAVDLQWTMLGFRRKGA